MRQVYTITIAMLFLTFAASLAQEASTEAAPEQAAFDFPDSREGEIAEAFIASFNSGDEAAVSTFISKYGNQEWQDGEAKELYAYKRMHQLLGELLPQSIVKSDDADIVVLVRSESVGSYFSVGISLDDAEPRLLNDHYIRPAAPPED